MKLYELTSTANFNEAEVVTDLRGASLEGQTGQDQEEDPQAMRDDTNDLRDKILMTGRGENHKKAKRIASNARTNAKASNIEKDPPKDEEVIQGVDDTPHTTQGNVGNWRLQQT